MIEFLSSSNLLMAILGGMLTMMLIRCTGIWKMIVCVLLLITLWVFQVYFRVIPDSKWLIAVNIVLFVSLLWLVWKDTERGE